MLTNHIALAETATTEDLTDWTERREALRIRPLIECPRLRAAMGNVTFPTQAGAANPERPTRTSGKRMPKNSSSPTTSTRTKHSAKPKVAAR